MSKHLRVLREARLVRARKRGREWHFSLDARPLAEVYREWLESFAAWWISVVAATDESLRRAFIGGVVRCIDLIRKDHRTHVLRPIDHWPPKWPVPPSQFFARALMDHE